MGETGQSIAVPRIAVLQAGRGLAALSVVALHSAANTRGLARTLPPVIAGPASHGGLGVDFFFVLSGFIIHHVSKNFDPKHYAVSRFRRIFLPYWPVGIAVALAYAALPGASADARYWNWFTTLTLVPVGEPALVIAWTLQLELMFYLAYGIGRAMGRPITATAIMAAAYWLSGANLAVEFLFGVLACEAVDRKLKVRPLLLIPLAAFLLLPHVRELYGLTMAIVIVGLVRAEPAGRLRVPLLLIFLGDASYSIYLVHSPIASIAAPFFSSPLARFLGCLVLGTLAGIGYHLTVEKPLFAFRLSPKRKSRAIPA